MTAMFQLQFVGFAVLAWTGTARAQYSLWPAGVDATSLAASIGISTGCLAALSVSTWTICVLKFFPQCQRLALKLGLLDLED